ncbi:hypothetical protein [Kitasatospora cineracea]|uniref:D-alanyl-D-alanine carboxypeptidase n=1 Tax=Kitasatospora cineracea TaxID=88074 RepID=A0A8G1USE7_9ACTN|nr:hypothetical protein [Kitasatospora cineracea]ROR46982.1 hypothetical protein EDD39_5291 [Kitasatospora cineracea]
MSLSPGFSGRRGFDTSRLPPGQYPTHDFPVLSAGPTPAVDPDDWVFTVASETGWRAEWTWQQFLALPQQEVTTNAGATYTGAAERDGRTLLVTVMHPANGAKVYEEAAALLDWGFAAAGKVTPVGTLAEDGAPEQQAPAAAAQPVADAPAPSGTPAGSAAPAAPAGGLAAHAAAGGPGPATWSAVGLCAAVAVAGLLRLRALRRRAARSEG